MAHDSPLAGHLGVRRTTNRIRENYYWEHWEDDVKHHVRTCIPFQKRKGPPQTLKSPLNPIQSKHVILDITYPGNMTADGNKYILIIADHYTKFTTVHPIPNQEASTIARVFIEQFVCLYGAPEIISTDRGPNFTSTLFTEISKVMGIEKRTSTAYHPESQGLVERYNSTLKTMLSEVVNNRHSDWDRLCPFLQFAYNSSRHETTNISPNYLVFGRDIPLPSSSGLSIPDERYVDQLEYQHVITLNLKRAIDLVRNSITLAQNRYKKQHDKDVYRPTDFWLGMEVLVYIPRVDPNFHQRKKLGSLWHGPYRVLDIQEPKLKLRLSSRPKKPADWVHETRCKEFFPRYPTDFILNPDQHDILIDGFVPRHIPIDSVQGEKTRQIPLNPEKPDHMTPENEYFDENERTELDLQRRYNLRPRLNKNKQ